jgi:hypothetical protein
MTKLICPAILYIMEKKEVTNCTVTVTDVPPPQNHPLIRNASNKVPKPRLVPVFGVPVEFTGWIAMLMAKSKGT